MPIFQKSVVNKYLKNLDELTVNQAYKRFIAFYGNKIKLHNILNLKEENYQEGFLREIFVNVLGYTISPDIDFNITTEFKNRTDSKKADGAILKDNTAIGVIELKSTKTPFLESITNQAFNYKHNQPNCRYVITSNFHNIRFYIDNSTEFEEFDLFELTEKEFAKLYLFLSKDSIFSDIPLKLKEETKFHEENITDKFYRDYKQFKDTVFENFVKNNPQYDKLTLFRKSQKLLDRFIFVWFAEDCGLIAPNAIQKIIDQYYQYIKLDDYKTLYSRFIQLFNYLDKGYKSKLNKDIYWPPYNGGLFMYDEIIDSPETKLDDSILLEFCPKISTYDFSTELDVNILGHIFEHSLNEIEEITAELKGEILEKSKTKRKKDGIFYTPKYITLYIIENTIGKLCSEKKEFLKIHEIEISDLYRKNEKTTKLGKELFEILNGYKKWLNDLKILDPACGSGAFLNQALDYLINEHKKIDDIIAELTGDKVRLFDTDKTVLESNIFGVDINEESVEIAKLSLWLRTAKKDRQLSDLNNNIKCGNSLINNKVIAGEKAFDWQNEFPEIMQNGGFDVIIGNPPYGVKFNDIEKNYLTKFDSLVPDFEIYIYFISLAIKNLLNKTGFLTYIIPNTFLSILYGLKYRKDILENYFVNHISDLSNDNTFVDASVRTCIISITKQDLNTGITDIMTINSITKEFELSKQIDKQHLNSNIDNWLNISKTDTETELLVQKIKSNKTLTTFFEVSQGLIPYRRSDLVIQYGEEQGNKIVDERLWHSETKLSDEYKKEILGKDIQRYVYSETNSFIRYGKHVASYVPEKFFNQPRLLIREITNCKLFCTYVEKELYNNPSIINIIKRNEGKVDLKYLLAIINSTLIGWYHNQTSPKAQKGLFPKILINDVRNLPIAFTENQTEFIEKTELMLDLKNQLQKKQNDFVKILESNFKLKKITEKILNFFSYDFNQLISELKKQRIEIALKKQIEWKELFHDFKTQLIELQQTISGLDKEIDNLVYNLYGFTDKEINIIENYENDNNTTD